MKCAVVAACAILAGCSIYHAAAPAPSLYARAEARLAFTGTNSTRMEYRTVSSERYMLSAPDPEHRTAQPGAIGRSDDQNETRNGRPITATLDRAGDRLFYAGGNSPCGQEQLRNGCVVRRDALLFMVRGGELVGIVNGHVFGGRKLVDAFGMVRQ